MTALRTNSALLTDALGLQLRCAHRRQNANVRAQ